MILFKPTEIKQFSQVTTPNKDGRPPKDINQTLQERIQLSNKNFNIRKVSKSIVVYH
jgi:hypothetical protein